MKKTIFARAGWAAIVLCAALSPGCHRHSSGNHDEHAREEPNASQITLFGERSEIFTEHRPVVAGKPTKFVTHVTDLATSEPRRAGAISYRIERDGIAGAETTHPAPSRAGIYEVPLTFPGAGEWKLALIIPHEGGTERIQFPPIVVHASETEAGKAPEQVAPEGISFLKEQQWKILSKTEPVARRALAERVRLAAIVTAKPGLLAAVNAPIAGRLLSAPGKRLPIIGDKVEAGETVALLQPSFSEIAARIAEAEGEVARTRLAVEQAEVVFKRMEALAKAEARTSRELQEADFALKTARATLAAALAVQATYEAARSGQAKEDGFTATMIELKSPIDGTIVSQAPVALGEYVVQDRALLTILDARTVFIEARIPESDARRLDRAKSAYYELPGDRSRYQPILGAGNGRLVFSGMQVDPQTRTASLVYEIPNGEGRLRVGESLTLHVETAQVENAIAIPDSAIVEEQGLPVAYVQLGGETFERREVTLGIRDGNWVQVLGGLKENERVVTRGAYAVRLAANSSAMPAHGHAH